MKQTKKQLWKAGAQLLVASIIGLSLPVQGAYAGAGVSYTSSDSSPAAQISGTSTYLSDSGMIWIGDDAEGSSQIYYKDLSAGEQKQVSTVGSPKDSAMIGGDIIVWEDKRDVPNDLYNRDIFSYNLLTGEEKKLNTKPGQHVQPVTDGAYVIWYDRDTMGDMYLYDVAAGTVKLLGQGRYPMVGKGKAVYLGASDGGLGMTDISSGQTKQLLLPTDGSYVDWFTFNGRYVLWKQVNLNSKESQYRMMDLESGNGQTPVDLTPLSKKKREYSQMTIGSSMAAWLEDKDGIAQIVGANLKERETFPITQASADQRLLNYAGDQLAVRSDNDSIVFRQFERVTTGPASASPQAAEPAGATDSVAQQVTPAGGVVQTRNKEATLAIPEGALQETALIGISKNNKVKLDAASPDGSKPFKQASGIWDITSDQPFVKAVSLSLAFDKATIAPNQVKKLAVYTYKESTGKWQLSGGAVDSGAGTVTVSTKETGAFAVWLNDKSFGDAQGHWAQQMIEILASRGIVDGVEEDRFFPEDRLTRAQFTKMLMGAIGQTPEGGGNAAFGDVPADYWGYGWIEAAAQAGIVEGDSGLFHPEEPLTREQMTTMLIRALHLGGQAAGLKEQELAQWLAFDDVQELSPWAKANAALAVKLGLIEGNGNKLMPAQQSTRAQAAAVIYRVLAREKLI